MHPKVFRLSSIRRWFSLLSGVLCIGLFIWLGVSSFGFSLFRDGFLQKMFIIVFLVVFVLILIIGYMAWMAWSYRIEFWQDELRAGNYWNLLALQYFCPYAEIERVQRSAAKGTIEIAPRNGKSFQIMSMVDGGCNALLDELEKYIPSPKFQPFLREELNKASKVDRTRFVFPFLIWPLLALQFAPMVILPTVAWNTAWGSGKLSDGYVNNYWNEDDGTVWASIRGFDDKTEVVRIDNHGERSWILENDDDVLYVEAIVANDVEQPWLLQKDFFLHWTGESWQKVQSNGYFLRANPPLVIDNNFWTIASKENQYPQNLLSISLEDGHETLYSLPAQLAENGFFIQDISSAPNHSIVTLLVKKGYPQAHFYSFQNGEWILLCSLDIEWRVSKIQLQPNDMYIRVDAFTVDNAGQIWVIKDQGGVAVISRYNALTNEWEWSQIATDCDLCSTHYSGIVVDQHERVWLAAGYGRKEHIEDTMSFADGWGVDVFKPRWGDAAEHMVRYTDKNSNYQVGFASTGLRMSQDGRIWAARDSLVWIDGNASDLPQPMSDVFVKATDPLNLMIGYAVLLGLIMIFSIGTWIIKLFRKRRSQLI